MEPTIRQTCSICQEDLLSDHISFTCNHSFCFKCHPYLLFNLLRSPGIDRKFFEEPQAEHLCLICGEGKTQFPFESLFQELYQRKSSLEESKGPENKKLCDACQENPAESFCIDCSKSFCEGCLEYIHKPKRYQGHKITCLEELKAEKFQCTCPAKHYLTHFCLKCQKATCSYCLKSEHDGHGKQVPLEKVIFPLANIEIVQSKLNELKQNYAAFRERFLKKVDTARNLHDETWNKMIDQMIQELQSLKVLNAKKSNEEFQFLSSQTQLLQSSISVIKEEASQNHLFLHPNKQFHLLKLLDGINEAKMDLETDWAANYEENLRAMEEIQKISSLLKDQNTRVMKLKGDHIIKISKPKPKSLKTESVFLNFCFY